MKFIQDYLPEKEYYSAEHKKEQIYLHHTVSSTAASAINWWKQDGLHIATAYLIEKDGTIYENFDPKCWSFHLGLKNTNGRVDKKSIGIEIVNEGWLTKKGDDFFWFEGKSKYRGEVIELETPWRGQKYFAKYTEEQVKSAAIVCKFLLYNLSIPFNIIEHYNYDKTLINDYKGILSHCNVRSDKTDLSPAFPMEDFIKSVTYLEKNPVVPKGLDLIGV
jgi:N-acetyl-anhydromuramyl-L-alanine amidase AmpD